MWLKEMNLTIIHECVSSIPDPTHTLVDNSQIHFLEPQWEMNLTIIHECVSSIPDPTQWVKDLVLP